MNLSCIPYLQNGALGWSGSKILSISDDLCFHWLVGRDYGCSSNTCLFLAVWWEGVNSSLSEVSENVCIQFLALEKITMTHQNQFLKSKTMWKYNIQQKKPLISLYIYCLFCRKGTQTEQIVRWACSVHGISHNFAYGLTCSCAVTQTRITYCTHT